MKTLEKIAIGYDLERQRNFERNKELKKNAFLDILSHLDTFPSIKIQPNEFKALKTNFLKAIEKRYSANYPGIKETELYKLLGIDIYKLEELEENYNRIKLELDDNGNPINYPDFNIYAETESEEKTFYALESILQNLKILKNEGRIVLIGELNNALFGAFEIDLNTMTIKPKAEYIKNSRYQKRKGNPRLKM